MRAPCKTTSLSFFILPFFGLWSAGLAADGDWPQWRGPHRDGRSRETGLLEHWPDGGPPLLWKARGLGDGYSNIAAVGVRIFTMGDRDGTCQVVALGRSDGKELWSAKVGRSGEPGGFEGPRSTPTVDGDLLFALGQYGDLVCLKAASGEEVWRTSLTGDLDGKRPGWGFTESVLVDGDALICTPGGAKGTLAALEKKSGRLIWRSAGIRDGAQYASAIVVEHEDARQYVQLTMKTVFGVDAATGKTLWQASWPGRTAVVPTPVFGQGCVYVTSGYGVGCNLFPVGRGKRVEGLYRGSTRKVMKNHHGGVILVDGHVYGYSDGGGWICQELRSGRLAWREKGRLGKGSIAYAGGRLCLRAEGGRGTVVLIEASPQGYRERGRFDPPDRTRKNSWTHPVIAGGKLYLRDQDTLLCYDVKAR